MQGEWPASWRKLDIAVRELYPIVLIVRMFGHKFAHSTILFYCDNQVIVNALNKQTSRNKKAMTLLRPLVLDLLCHCIRFRARYIPTQENILADAIWFQETPQMLQQYGMNLQKMSIPELLLPSAVTV